MRPNWLPAVCFCPRGLACFDDLRFIPTTIRSEKVFADRVETGQFIGAGKESKMVAALTVFGLVVNDLIDDLDLSGYRARDRWAERVSAAFTVHRPDEAVVALDSTSAEELSRWPVESPWAIEAGPDAVLVTTALPGWRALLGGAEGADPSYLQVRDPRTGETSGRLVLSRAPWSTHILDGRSAIPGS